MPVSGSYNPPGSGGTGTDDQQLTLNPTSDILTLEDGGTVDLSPYKDAAELCDVFGNPIQ